MTQNTNGRFGQLHLQPLDEYDEGRRIYLLTEDFAYITRFGDKVVVPKGTKTDFASVPKCLHMLFPPDGEYLYAAVVHDYLYENGIGTKKDADYLFKHAMLATGIPRWKVFILYHCAKIWGKGNFQKTT